jgi:hypothetical protein
MKLCHIVSIESGLIYSNLDEYWSHELLRRTVPFKAVDMAHRKHAGVYALIDAVSAYSDMNRTTSQIAVALGVSERLVDAIVAILPYPRDDFKEDFRYLAFRFDKGLANTTIQARDKFPRRRIAECRKIWRAFRAWQQEIA